MGIFGPTIISKEIEYIDSGYRSMFSVQSSLVMNPIFNYGNKKIKINIYHNYVQENIQDLSSMKTKCDNKVKVSYQIRYGRYYNPKF